MPRSTGLSRELRLLSPDSQCKSDVDKQQREKKALSESTNRDARKDTNDPIGDSNDNCGGTCALTTNLFMPADLDSDYDEASFNSSDYESEESSVVTLVSCDSSDDEDEIPIAIMASNSNDSDKENTENPPLKFVSPPRPIGKGRLAFEAEEPQNVLLSHQSFKCAHEKSMICPNEYCYSKTEETDDMHCLMVTQRQYGFATELFWECKYCDWCVVVAPPMEERMEDMPELDTNKEDPERFHNCSINCNMGLLIQKLGLGFRALALIFAMLGMSNSIGSKRKWDRSLDGLGFNLALNVVAEQVFIENQTKEKEATIKYADQQLLKWLQSQEGVQATSNQETAPDVTNRKRDESLNIKDGKVGIGVTNDTGWQRRTVGFGGGTYRHSQEELQISP